MSESPDLGGAGDALFDLDAEAPRLRETLARAIDTAFDGIMITDARLEAPGPTIVYVNAAVTEITGYPAAELVGGTPRLLQGPKTHRPLLDRMRVELARSGTFQGRTTNYRRDGGEFEMEWSISTLRDDAGEPRFYVAVQRDATAFRALLDDAERRAQTDEMTGLINRPSFDSRLRLLLSDPSRGERIGLIAVGVDELHAVIEAHGRATGDAVLRIVADRLREVVRGEDTVARTGGEQLTIVMTDSLGPAGVVSLAERLREAVAGEPVRAGDADLSITASFGVAHARVSGREPAHLIADADRALARSKASGRNRVSTAPAPPPS